MGFFSNFFNSKKDDSSNKEDSLESPFSPKEPELPTDELFMIRFKNNGGKFLYCENAEELNENLLSILLENDWFECNALCVESHLEPLLQENKITNTPTLESKFALLSCEGLIAEEGSILFSSNQLREKKPGDLPDNVIVVGKTSQIVAGKSDSLRMIKRSYVKDYPTNITAISYFKARSNDDLMNFGSSVKNLYLLLIEDL